MGSATRRRTSPLSPRFLPKLCVGLLLLTSAEVALAQAGNPESEEAKDKRALIISRTTMSPFCPGRTLDSCPSPNATQWRQDIREMVAKGMTTEEIRKAMEARTEHDLSGEPSTVLDSVLPAAVTGVALVLLILLLRTLVRARAAASAPALAKGSPNKSEQDLDARLDAELEKLEEGGLDEKVS
jgi:cytochrome c-type biogenesis protein CcmH/NrfF